MRTHIASIRAWEALDSRGRPTVGCRVELASGAAGRVITPSGASIGSHEALELRDGGDRYGGLGVARAVASVNAVISRALRGADASEQERIDRRLEDLDPDPRLGTLGANAVLSVSLAVMIAHARAAERPLWRTVAADPDGDPVLPMPMVNILSGGAHARRLIDIQDVLAVPIGASSFGQAMEWVARVRGEVARLVDEAGGSSALVADEGGLAAQFASNEGAVELVARGIEAAGFAPGTEVAIAIDIAANQFHGPDGYRLQADSLVLDTRDWLDRLERWTTRYPIVSLEDLLHEDDWRGWAEATARLGRLQVLGDDLFATNVARLRSGIRHGAGNAILVKLNQAGTVTRAREAFALARSAGYATVVSARSGDTEDSWLADLAVGWQADQIKVGSTTRSERTAKWNRLLEIEALADGRSRLYTRTR